MDYLCGDNLIQVQVTRKKAAELFITGELNITNDWHVENVRAVMNELQKLDINELLEIVDNQHISHTINASDIPQFGSSDTIRTVPIEICKSGLSSMNYAQLGFNLRKDPDASVGANLKYGETHGKGAYMAGLVDIVDKRVQRTALTYWYSLLENSDEQRDLIRRLYFRFVIIQILLKKSKESRINGYDYMGNLSPSTKFRRHACIKMILKDMRLFENEELSRRIDNIVWEQEE